MQTLLDNFFSNIYWDSLVHFPSSNTCKSCGNFFWKGESLPSHKITCHLPLCPVCRPSATTVARTSYWWSMELAAPQKYCMKDTSPSCYQLCHLQHYFRDRVQLQATDEKCRSSAAIWTCMCQGWVFIMAVILSFFLSLLLKIEVKCSHKYFLNGN